MANAVFEYPLGLELASSNALWNDNLKLVLHLNNNLLDSKGSNNGTRSGTGTEFDAVNQILGVAAGQFNGTDDVVSCGNDASLPTSNSSWSVGGWFKTTDTYGGVVSRKPAGVGDWVLLISSGALIIRMYNDAAGVYAEVTGGSGLGDGVWHHFVAVWTLSTKLELWIDGVSVGSDTSFSGTKNAAAVDFELGRGDAAYFSGYLDEVFITDDALLQAEIEALYAEQNTPVSVTIPNLETLPLERPKEKFQSSQVLGGGSTVIQDLGLEVQYVKLNINFLSAAKYAELVTFFQITVNYMEKTFTFTDEIGTAYTNLRLTKPSFSLLRVTTNEDGMYSGQLLLKSEPA